MKSLAIYSLSAVILFLSACAKDKIPGVYRIDIQQGNEVTQEMLAKLEPGMDKKQVTYVMGTPLLIDTFHPNRWDYIYSFQPGNGNREQRRITLHFDDEEKLRSVEGDTRIVEKIELAESERTDTNVVVPLSEHKPGFWRSIGIMMGIVDEDEPHVIADDDPDLPTGSTPPPQQPGQPGGQPAPQQPPGP